MSTGGDVRPTPGAGMPRYQTPSRNNARDNAMRYPEPGRSGIRTTTRDPGTNNPSRSSVPSASDPGVTSRYRSGNPATGMRDTGARDSGSAGKGSAGKGAPRADTRGTGGGVADLPRGTASPKPRTSSPSVSGRYAMPRDTVAGVAPRSGSTKSDAGRGGTRPDGTSNRGTNAPIATAKPVTRAPRLTTSATPSLSTPNTPAIPGGIPGATPINNGVVAPISSGVVGPATCPSPCFDNSWCSSSWGCSFWDPWGCSPCHSHWGCWGSCWSGCGWWGCSWWWPCWSLSSCWWNSCYHDCWWGSTCYPSYVSSSYWWYPSSSYCPSYLYVPSTIVVVDDSGYGGATEPLVVDSGRRAPDAEVAGMTTSLAAKYVELGDFYFKAGRFTDAVGAYGKARSYAPEDASLHFVLADAVFAEGDYLYAAFLIGEGLRLDPGLASAPTDKRTFYGDVATFDAQMAALDRHLERRPDDALAHLLKGYNLRFSGRSVDAVVSFRRALELDPGNRTARIFLDAIEKPAPAEPAVR